MNKKFSVDISSDLDYEEMVADIIYDNNAMAKITQESGPHHMEIEIFESPKLAWNVPLDEFIKTLQFAKERLIKMQKLPDTDN